MVHWYYMVYWYYMVHWYYMAYWHVHVSLQFTLKIHSEKY